jgi:hypothetical protein
MADDQETRVGHQVVEGAGRPTETHRTQPEAEVFFSRDETARHDVAPTPAPPSQEDERERGGSSPAEADRIAAEQEDSFAQKPHLYVLGAFAGAFVAAQVLKHLTEGD